MDAYLIRPGKTQGVKRNKESASSDDDSHSDSDSNSDGNDSHRSDNNNDASTTHEIYDVTTRDDKTVSVPGTVLKLLEAIEYTPENRAVNTDLVDYTELMCAVRLAEHYMKNKNVDAYVTSMSPMELFQATNVAQTVNLVPYILPAARRIANLMRGKTPEQVKALFSFGVA